MTAFDFIVAGGVALGALQVLAGGAVGWWLCRRCLPTQQSADRARAARLAADLRSLTDTVASSVRRHNATIESIEGRLRTEAEQSPGAGGQAPLTDLVVGVVRQMLTANKQLRRDLQQTEAELKRTADQLASHRREARTDPLTTLPNRRALDERLERLMDQWRSNGEPFSLLLLDIDHFKRFNDTHGHPVGDAALRAFAAAVTGELGRRDFLARFGGEEFAVLLPNASLAESVDLAAKARHAVGRFGVSVGGAYVEISASGGLAAIRPGELGQSLVTRADEALYAAKAAGRGRLFVHDGNGVQPLDGGTPQEEVLPLPAHLPAEVERACRDLREGFEDLLSGRKAGGPAYDPADKTPPPAEKLRRI